MENRIQTKQDRYRCYVCDKTWMLILSFCVIIVWASEIMNDPLEWISEIIVESISNLYISSDGTSYDFSLFASTINFYDA